MIYFRHIFNLKTYLVKFISCALAVGSGMPIGKDCSCNQKKFLKKFLGLTVRSKCKSGVASKNLSFIYEN